MQCYSYSKFKKLARLLMGISISEFDMIVKNIKYSSSEDEKSDSSIMKLENPHYPILSEIYELLDIISGSGHVHFGCSNDSPILIITDVNELWEALFHLADKKCMRD